MFAKTILDKAIAKKGKTPETVAAIDLMEIIKNEINSKLSKDKLKTDALVLAGSGYLLYDHTDSIIYASPFYKKVIRDLGLQERKTFEVLEALGLCRKCSTVNDLVASEVTLKRTKQVIDVSISPIFDRSMKITGAISFIRDITLKAALEDEVILQAQQLRQEILAKERAQYDLKSNQAQLIQASKLASLGEMAGGISHEINNPLTVILGRIELLEGMLKRQAYSSEFVLERLGSMKKAGLRIKGIVDAMRTLCRTEVGHEEEVPNSSVNKVLDDVLTLCQEKYLVEGVQTIVKYSATDVHVPCHFIELGQVFINLINNAHDAIADLPEKWIRITVSEDDQVRISFEDSGKGIPLSVQERMFEPFYTTKPMGKGMGIGMSISKRIIENYKGSIIIDNQIPNTKIDVVLPKGHIPSQG